MDERITVALISSAGVVLSAVIALITARVTASREIRKLKLEWQREDRLSADEDYSAMVVSVSELLELKSSAAQQKAIRSIAVLRTRETGKTARLLAQLTDAVSVPWDLRRAKALLEDIVHEKQHQRDR